MREISPSTTRALQRLSRCSTSALSRADCDMVRDIIMAELDFYKVALEAEQCKSIWQNAQNARAEAEKAAKSRLARKLRDAKSA